MNKQLEIIKHQEAIIKLLVSNDCSLEPVLDYNAKLVNEITQLKSQQEELNVEISRLKSLMQDIKGTINTMLLINMSLIYLLLFVVVMTGIDEYKRRHK